MALRLLARAVCRVVVSGCEEAVTLHSPRLHRCYTRGRQGHVTSPAVTWPQRWLVLDPVLEEALVPRRLALSPLESWVSAQHQQQQHQQQHQQQCHQHHHQRHHHHQEMILPSSSPSGVAMDENPGVEPVVVPAQVPGAIPLKAQSVLKIRRRKMNHHKYRKLTQRMRFHRRGIVRRRAIRKQRKFEKDLEKVWTSAGLEESPQGWKMPKIYHFSGSRKPLHKK
ncbi:small ribosomal subunit protein mS38 isoform X2 [Petromyzon marinus]|uniref:Small ribosomal subunit protein mS38 n=1 Tax=Petromyzon marinus TaxID=7757 RepID=A0AAJ7SLI7_PETMA|nr:aurora kinase A-interacting protein isoform X2 [Petromyzon marinus]